MAIVAVLLLALPPPPDTCRTLKKNKRDYLIEKVDLHEKNYNNKNIVEMYMDINEFNKFILTVK